MFAYLLYYLLSPFLWILLHFFALFHPKLRKHILGQKSSVNQAVNYLNANRRDKTLVIFHAASAGEFEQLKPILKKIDRQKYFILQTFFSPTIFEKENQNPLFDTCCYHPFDFPWSARSFFGRIDPDYYILTRHDLWPHHLRIAQEKSIKTILINANLHDQSGRLKPLFRNFNRWLFSKLDLILTGSERLKNNLSLIADPQKVIVTGDTRFDQVLERKNRYSGQLMNKSVNSRTNIILGSIIPSDYPVVLKGLRSYLGKKGKSLKALNQGLIVVPHETDELTLTILEGQLMELGLPCQRFSRMSSENTPSVCLVDTVGILADLYAHAQLAYIGAGFGAGVHSVLEPAVYGIAVSYGPNIHILDEAISLEELGLGTMIHSAEDFCRFLEISEDAQRLQSVQIKTKAFINSNRGASDRVLQKILGQA